jgi:antitoxin component YwqK of YwqJK toxin-antitoxin module
MKKFLFLLATALLQFSAGAQRVTTDGKGRYVYPYGQEITFQKQIFLMDVLGEETVVRDTLNSEVMASEIYPVAVRIPMESSPQFRKMKRMVLEAREKYPHVLYNYSLPLEEDLVPAMEALPDGHYVEFYRDLPYVKDRQLRYRNDVVCAYFSLKDNKLDGPACWYSPGGDTVKYGSFRNGLKEGEWHARNYDMQVYGDDITMEKVLTGFYTDTFYVDVNYRDGLLDGPYASRWDNFPNETGSYLKGKPAGEWKHFVQKSEQRGMVTYMLDEVVLVRHYTVAAKPEKGTAPIVRNQLIPREVDRGRFNIPYDARFLPFSEYYSIFTDKEEEGLELPEEKINSYPGEEEYEVPDWNSINSVSFGHSDHQTKYTFGGKDYTRNDLLDSIGYEFGFEGVYEEFYPNGQLKLRFEVRNGELVKEDTVYYDNGTPANYLTFDAEKKEYHEHVLDYDGKPVTELLYDEKGNFIRIAEGSEMTATTLIDGRKYETRDYEQTFRYYDEQAMMKPLTSKVLLSEELWKFDSTVAMSETFDPETGVLEQVGYSLSGKPRETFVLSFSDDYEVVRGTSSVKAGKLESRTTISGSYLRNPLSGVGDTLLTRKAHNWYYNYDAEYDNMLYYDGQPFTGKFDVTTHRKRFAFSSAPHSVSIGIGSGKKQARKLRKMLRSAYRGKKLPEAADHADSQLNLLGDFGDALLYDLAPFISDVYEPVYADMFEEFVYESSDEKVRIIPERKAPAFDKRISGQFTGGKPSGVWTVRDQFGKVTASVPFEKGELEGRSLRYATAEPERKSELDRLYEYYGEEENPLLKDSFPAKKIHYLSRESHYRGGLLQGPYREFNWLGDTLQSMSFELGSLQGEAIERSKLAYSVAGYEQGLLDGISRTYLTLPGRDTTLLFDLNFQDGALQGESKSYHMSGKLAKHGFFLGGQPIDDYEAFDTLGFRYQYVKFRYNQPVEEKIWEENALSVRYTFDWRDSVFFEARNIAGSESLEQTLMELGLYSDYDVPYYGRPSVLSKKGVNYHMTKYYPNDTIARDGDIEKGKKTGCWQFYDYEGRKLYEVDYFDTIVVFDSVRFKSKGILTSLDAGGNEVAKSYIVEKVEKYDCSHTDHHEVRMLIAFWEKDTSAHRMNGYVKNYYDNGVLMNEGVVKNGVATGVWKFYDPYGSLNKVGEYKKGKRQGRWLSGDLSKVKYMGDICLNPNLPNLDEILGYEEKLLDISVINYEMGIVRKREYYGVNMNTEAPPKNYFGEGY